MKHQHFGGLNRDVVVKPSIFRLDGILQYCLHVILLDFQISILKIRQIVKASFKNIHDTQGGRHSVTLTFLLCIVSFNAFI